MTTRPRRRHLVEDFVAVRLDDARKAAGSRRRLRTIDHVSVQLPTGETATVRIVCVPASFNGVQPMLECPRCKRRCRSLRIAGSDLLCLTCLGILFHAKFRSQALPRQTVVVGAAEPVQ